MEMEYKLEKIDKKYYKEIYSWRNDPYAIEHNPFAPCDFDLFSKKMESFSSDLDQIYDGQDRKWIILNDDVVFSILGLTSINKMMKTAEISYQVNPKLRRQGIGAKAVYTLIKTVFDFTDIRKLTAIISHANIPSRKIAEKVGFKQEGLLRKHFIIQGIEVDEVIYGIFKDEVLRKNSI